MMDRVVLGRFWVDNSNVLFGILSQSGLTSNRMLNNSFDFFDANSSGLYGLSSNTLFYHKGQLLNTNEEITLTNS